MRKWLQNYICYAENAASKRQNVLHSIIFLTVSGHPPQIVNFLNKMQNVRNSETSMCICVEKQVRAHCLGRRNTVFINILYFIDHVQTKQNKLPLITASYQLVLAIY